MIRFIKLGLLIFVTSKNAATNTSPRIRSRSGSFPRSSPAAAVTPVRARAAFAAANADIIMHMSAIALPLRRTQSVSISADMLTLRGALCARAVLRSGTDRSRARIIFAETVDISITSPALRDE